MSNIPLSTPSFNGNEWKYLKDCVDTTWVSSSGKYVELFEENIAEYVGVKYAIACVNGTSSLYLSLKLAGVAPTDEVIAPTLTFIGTINAISYNGANPVFMDADNHFNIDVEKTIQFIHEETIFKKNATYNKVSGRKISAIVPVHVWGNAVWLDELIPLCKERNITVVEDAAQSLATKYLIGKNAESYTGSIGEIGCLSFNGNKIITAGGGGMILTSDSNIAERARYLTTQAKDDPLRFVHNEVGYNYRLTNIQAALGLAQLEQLEGILIKKRAIHSQYISKIIDIDGLSIAETPSYAENNCWMNILKINKSKYFKSNEELIKRFSKHDIQTRPIWHLNHLQNPYKGSQSYKIDNAYNLISDSLCIPSSNNISNSHLNKVINCLKN